MLSHRRIIRVSLIVGPALLGASAGCAAPHDGSPGNSHASTMVATGFINKSLTMPDGTVRNYVVFVPKAYTPDKPWPTILFLHGAGERGTDNRAQVRVGIGRAIRAREDSFAFITIMPQCAPDPAWWTAPSEKAYAMATLAETRKQYNVDPDRIYLTGLSMGGFGTWALAADHPRLWAAIVPICGRGDPATAPKFVHLPCWCFHGGADNVVPPKCSHDMIDALKKAGGNPKYTEYPGVGHNSWDKAYDTDELYVWLLAHRRK